MSSVIIPFDGQAKERAIKLLAAAEQLGEDATVVATVRDGFKVPDKVAEKAGLSKQSVSTGNDEPEPAAKKSAAKRTATKKTAAKKSTARKSTAKKATAKKSAKG